VGAGRPNYSFRENLFVRARVEYEKDQIQNAVSNVAGVGAHQKAMNKTIQRKMGQ
jgi:hypothetical protein